MHRAEKSIGKSSWPRKQIAERADRSQSSDYRTYSQRGLYQNWREIIEFRFDQYNGLAGCVERCMQYIIAFDRSKWAM